MSERFGGPRGTLDWTPSRMAVRDHVVRTAMEVFERAGYRSCSVPAFEEFELFVRSAGETSDVVAKEMYDFVDKGGRHVALRPEFTAGVVRMYLNELTREPQPVRLWTAGPAYRYNRVQRGRYREFQQFDVEAIGSADPAVDAELIALQLAWYGALGIDGLRVELNSIDTPAERRSYVARLVAYLDAHEDALSPDVRALRRTNPLRAFDTKDERSQDVLAGAPKITESLSRGAREHFELVCAFLDARGLSYIVVPELVRGLDYYSHTVWEVRWPPLGAQSTIGAGGRYDGFAEILGGAPTPGVGFAAGIERIVLSLEGQGLVPPSRPADVYVAIDEPAARPRLHAIADAIRARGARVEYDLAGRTSKGQLKQASVLGASIVVSCGAEEWRRGEATIRHAGRSEVVALASIAPTVLSHLTERTAIA